MRRHSRWGTRCTVTIYLGEQTKMGQKITSVLGIFVTAEGVECAGDILVSSGFSDSDISVFLPENLKPAAPNRGMLLSVPCQTPEQIARAKDIIASTMAQEESFARHAAQAQSNSQTPEPLVNRTAAVG